MYDFWGGGTKIYLIVSRSIERPEASLNVCIELYHTYHIDFLSLLSLSLLDRYCSLPLSSFIL
jgi:hypothetical protein